MYTTSRDIGGIRTSSISARSIASRPRVLYVSCHLPWPAISGGRRRELELIRRLGARFDVHLLVVSKTPGADLENASMLRHFCVEVEVFAAAPPEHGSGGTLPAQVRRHRCPAATARVREILAEERIDLIHVEGFYLMQHVPEWARQPILLAEQNIEYQLVSQRLASVGEPGGFAQLVRTKAAERRSWERATQLVAVTQEDRETIEVALPQVPVRVVPDGADHIPSLREMESEHGLERSQDPLLLLLANFAYAPNVDAARHLCGDILPLVRAEIPDVRLWLVGNAPPPDVLALRSEHIDVVGHVPEVLPYLDVADVIVCPLRIGGGVKVKALEALRRGKAIVSTHVGTQGLPPQARDAIAIADEPRGFADAIVTLLGDPPRRQEYERRAARAARELPSWDQAAQSLAGVYDEVLGRRPTWARRLVREAAVGGSR